MGSPTPPYQGKSGEEIDATVVDVYRGGSAFIKLERHSIVLIWRVPHMKTRLFFTNGFSEQDAFEAQSRGYLSHALVELESGQLFPVLFYDMVRLNQDLEEMAQHGEGFIADPGMIVVKEVTIEAMTIAVESLASRGFFDHLLPTTMEMVNASADVWPPPLSSKGQLSNLLLNDTRKPGRQPGAA